MPQEKIWAARSCGRAVKGILLDLDGVVYVGETVLPGSLEAVSQIRTAGLPLKFVTNTTRRPLRRIVNDPAWFGLRVEPRDIYTPAAIARNYLPARHLASFLVVHPDLYAPNSRVSPAEKSAATSLAA